MCQVHANVRSDTSLSTQVYEVPYIFIGHIDSSYNTGKIRHLYMRLVPWFVGASHIWLTNFMGFFPHLKITATQQPLEQCNRSNKCDVIKQNESEVGNNMLLGSEVFISFKYAYQLTTHLSQVHD